MAFFPSIPSLLGRRNHSEDDSDKDPTPPRTTNGNDADKDADSPPSTKKFKPTLEILSFSKKEYRYSWKIGSFAAVRNRKFPLEFRVTVRDANDLSSDWSFRFLQEENGLGHIERKLEAVQGWKIFNGTSGKYVLRQGSPKRYAFRKDNARLPSVTSSLDIEIRDESGAPFYSNAPGKISAVRMLNCEDEPRWFPLSELPVLPDGSLVIRMTFRIYADKQQAPGWWWSSRF